jgi:hypothetical protein
MLFVGAADKVLIDDRMSQLAISTEQPGALPAFELAAPRNCIFAIRARSAAASSPAVDCVPGSTTWCAASSSKSVARLQGQAHLGFRYGYERADLALQARTTGR